MTDSELVAAIQADATAKGLVDTGNDAGCASRLVAILPTVVSSTYVNERGVFAAFADPTDAEQIMQAIEVTAAGNPSATPPVAPNPVVSRALKWMEPTNGGIDHSYPSVRAMLDQLAAAGLISAVQCSTLKALTERPATVTAGDVSRVWAQFRPNGRIT